MPPRDGRTSGAAYPAGLVRPQARRGLAAVAVAVVAARSLRRVEVVGDSMRPALLPGDRLVVCRWSPLRPGDVVALRDPRTGAPIVKRVECRAPGRALRVTGDNSGQSTDSRHFGPISHTEVIGRVVYRYSPPQRTGRVSRPGTRW